MLSAIRSATSETSSDSLRRRATRPSRAAKERRIAAKKRRGETKRLRRKEE